MFDVSWSDPARETVGQRKTRKEQQIANGKSRNTSGVSRVSSVRSSNSSGSKGAQKPSLLNFFGAGRNEGGSRLGFRPKTPSTTNNSIHSSQRFSTITTDSIFSGSELPGISTSIPQTVYFAGSPPYFSDTELSARADVSESVFSGWTEKSVTTDSSYGSISESMTCARKTVQPPNESSFVTQSTEAMISSSKDTEATEDTVNIVHVSASNVVPSEVQALSGEGPTSSTTFAFPMPKCMTPETSPKPISRKERALPLSPSPFLKKNKPSYTWKPPESWVSNEATPTSSPTRSFSAPLRPIQERRHRAPPTEVANIRKSIRRMEAASPKIVLERLKEEWTQVADASVYRELELEKQLWMLTALRSLKRKNSLQEIMEAQASEPTKILSLYENHASSSSLAALTIATEVHHLSTSPLSSKTYPNIHPTAVPEPISQLPYPSNTFSHIHAFPIASLLPASSIPDMLKECHRTLTLAPNPIPSTPASPSSPDSSPPSPRTIPSALPKSPRRGGTLHLTLLDPSPLASTLGPRLRAWLDTHLLLHLERQFRCLHPSRLFPVWLSDARLRAEGSTIIHVRFFASVGRRGAGAAGGGDADAESTKLELKTVVGRMLWKEMWGGYVQGQRWWWEDERIVEECDALGTCWEYALVEAVKELEG
ncbi:uncharacterized protein L3040_000958 [Drepanopeziza brunnea f. sp. 'multigermtubi']|uniref:Uncharacterized protein n=1 Tax=Marssonina brunnea f. sp. multigermtubi (strain MB_m1) TaxID=1072389 RepID=K1Y6M9_MARBU|nr:uncharacterized protein MBM_01536 [Drepanopeziza brunnea f. sp. 'multigermtubi' MB_m1]EKD20854.1 hypothetical protein MBM_01536 [Drepanopeziza brunnea f. sp. 'multigermtubi' MB_m1]KAJ5054692.1 hypothetical protein L3040_000958 [Drepanopeziza brunnea f. sp. 'multigermtubi']